MFSCLGRQAFGNVFFLKVEQFYFVCKIFGGCVQTLMEGKQKERGQPTYPLGPADFNTL